MTNEYRPDEEAWEGNSKEDDIQVERVERMDIGEYQELQDKLIKKVRKHIQQSDASNDLTNPEFL